MNKSIGLIQVWKKRQGGVVYRNHVVTALADFFDAKMIDQTGKSAWGSLSMIESIFNLLFLRGKEDLWIRDFFSTSFFTRKTKGKNLALIFHVDFSGFPLLGRIFFPIVEKIFFYRNLKKMDAIVTICDYWQKFFINRGFKNVYKIYNGFNLNDFNLTDKDTEDFKKKYGLVGKPIVYIGNCHKSKGVVDVYKNLRGLDVFLVASGRKRVNLPIITLDLDYSDYLKLLKASSVAITMSKFKEGWTTTTHEAMLCRTPVIGSGVGGMRELLEGGGQIVCQDFGQLREKAEFLLKNQKERDAMAEKGYNFAKNFIQERFASSWVNLIKEILK